MSEDDHSSLIELLGLTTSSVFAALVDLQMAFGSFEVGVIQRTAVPELSPETTQRELSACSRTGGSPRSSVLGMFGEDPTATPIPPTLSRCPRW